MNGKCKAAEVVFGKQGERIENVKVMVVFYVTSRPPDSENGKNTNNVL